MKQEKWFPVICCVILIIIAGFVYFHKESGKGKSKEDGFSATMTTSDSNRSHGTSNPEEQVQRGQTKECAVYICGAVRHPGVYRFASTVRVCDVIEAAGGLKKSADQVSINQAEYVTDGEQICILTKQEVRKQKQAAQSKDSITKQDSSGDKINLNKATAEQLMTLPGIGEAKAKRILAYRSEQGDFQKTEDIMKISGIKEGVYNQIKNSITVD